MPATRKKRRAAVAHENEERWLLTYADMITLLMALFMVLFSISSVNVSKYVTLQQSLRSAFSGALLSGGRSILNFGSQSTAAHSPAQAPVPAIMPLTPNVPEPVDQGQAGANAAQLRAIQREQDDFRALKWRLDQFAKAHGIASQVSTQITKQGLVVTILTDKLLFDSGSASLQPAGLPLLNEIGNLLAIDRRHPIMVEGFTDSVPIDTSQFPSNWELSTTRADTVLRYLLAHGIAVTRFGATGYADLHPVASNATAAGRALNRRVAIVFERINTYTS
jgi:chemotaxis protein MotB